MSDRPRSRKKDIVVQDLNGEVLIYDLKKDKAFCLNETSALIWQMCDGKKSVGEISRELSKKLDSTVNEDFVWLAIDQLKKEDLIANGEELSSNFDGMNRRDVIKKVGLASMIALPVVSFIVAPTAVNAQSCRVQNVITSTNNTCAQANCPSFCAGFYGNGTTGTCVQSGTDAICTCCTP